MISSYYYKGPADDPWEFQKTILGAINLLVGASGSGKTRYLNTIFNFSDFVVKGQPFKAGHWELIVRTNEFEYLWECTGAEIEKGKYQITSEKVERKRIDLDDQSELLVDRAVGNFVFGGNKLPKLELDKLSVTLLKEEDSIRPLYETFAKVQRRNFHDQGLRDALAIQAVPSELVAETKLADGMTRLWKQEHALSAKMFLLKETFPDLFKLAVDTFKGVFTTITECEIQMVKAPAIGIRTGGVLPVFSIKERGVSRWVGLPELSSGMQKVLLIVTDILTLPEGAIYIIDEYENSLGVNAIDFLPHFLLDHAENHQIIITTHHPYLINSMPMKSWRVFRREGSKVSIKNGEEFEQKYGKSKQQAFVQLLNDPFYIGS